MQRTTRQTLNIVALLGSITLSAVTDLANASSAEEAVLDRADRALSSGQPERALTILDNRQSAFELAENLADAAGLRCRAHIAMGQYEQAVTDCESAIAIDSGRDSWRYWNNLGAAHLHLDQYTQAENAFETAISISGWRRRKEPMRNLQIARELINQESAGQAIAAAQ